MKLNNDALHSKPHEVEPWTPMGNLLMSSKTIILHLELFNDLNIQFDRETVFLRVNL